jgi:hypothetical protein
MPRPPQISHDQIANPTLFSLGFRLSQSCNFTTLFYLISCIPSQDFAIANSVFHLDFVLSFEYIFTRISPSPILRFWYAIQDNFHYTLTTIFLGFRLSQFITLIDAIKSPILILDFTRLWPRHCLRFDHNQMPISTTMTTLFSRISPMPIIAKFDQAFNNYKQSQTRQFPMPRLSKFDQDKYNLLE